MDTIAVLEHAREKIDTTEKWFGGSQPATACDSRICAWIALGRAGAELNTDYGDCIDALCQTAGIPLGVGDLIRFNDRHAHAEVLDLFDRTIARLRSATPSDRAAQQET